MEKENKGEPPNQHEMTPNFRGRCAVGRAGKTFGVDAVWRA